MVFFSILYTSLTEKTTVLFTSSNSSFTECVRNHNLQRISSNNYYYNAFQSHENNQNMKRFVCAEEGEYLFTNCDWTELTIDYNGSAISLTNSESTLIVEKCSFTDCIVEADCGGAIYVYGINKATITESSFVHCNILSSDNNENGGGGIYLELVSDEVLIRLCSFLDNSVPHDGAGVDMWSCSCTTFNTKTFQDCRFIMCKGKAENSFPYNQPFEEGGGILAWENEYNVGISNTLFCECSNYRGGALEISVPLEVLSPFILFCLFHGNDATYGKDVCFGNCDTIPFSHSFTTSSGKYAVSKEEHPNEYYPHWFPQG